MSTAEIPVYFTNLVSAWYQGEVGRNAHLGHWDQPWQKACESASSGPQRKAEFQQAQERMDTVLLTMAGMTDGLSILDVGCGFGGLLERINARYSRMQLTGVNIDSRQLEICHSLQAQQQNRLCWQQADACELPFDDQCFDRVFCVEAMFHFSSRRRFLQEAARVLKPGGQLVGSDIQLTISESRAAGEELLPRFAIEALLRDGYGPWPDPWAEQGTVLQLSRAAGLATVELVDATASTLPSYQFILSPRWTLHQDPGDAAARSALLLHWLQANGRLKYVYFRAA